MAADSGKQQQCVELKRKKEEGVGPAVTTKQKY